MATNTTDILTNPAFCNRLSDSLTSIGSILRDATTAIAQQTAAAATGTTPTTTTTNTTTNETNTITNTQAVQEFLTEANLQSLSQVSSTNISSSLVQRDPLGNFEASVITADLIGTASTCITIPALEGDVTNNGNVVKVNRINNILVEEIVQFSDLVPIEQDIQNERTRALIEEERLSSDLQSEMQRAIEKETILQQDIEKESIRAKAIEVSLNQKILDETTRATTTEQSIVVSVNQTIMDITDMLNQSIVEETQRAQDRENEIEQEVIDETSRARSAEEVLTNSVNELKNTSMNIANSLQAEIDRAVSSEMFLEEKLNDEITRATETDLELSKAIDDEVNRATSAEHQLLTDVNQLQELTQELQTHIMMNEQLNSQQLQEITQSITDESNRAMMSESQLSSSIVQLESITQDLESRLASNEEIDIQQSDMLNAATHMPTPDTLVYRNSMGNSMFQSLTSDAIESVGETLNVAAAASTKTLNLATANSVQSINIGTGIGKKVINIGTSDDIINISGTVTNVNTTDTNVQDKKLVLNAGGAVSSSGNSGLYFEENNDATSSFIRIGTNRDEVEMKPFVGPLIRLNQSLSTTDSPTFSLVTSNVTGSASTFTTALRGDVEGGANDNLTTVSKVGGKTALAISQSVTDTTNATPDSITNRIVKRDDMGNFSANKITADLIGNASTSTKFSTALIGDVTGGANGTMTSVAFVGSKTAADVAKSVTDTSSATPDFSTKTIVKRDDFGSFFANKITAELVGNATTANKFKDALIGDVIGGANGLPTSVILVGNKTAADVAISVTETTNATPDFSTKTIVKRDALGNFQAGTITATLNGNASTCSTIPVLSGDVSSVGNNVTVNKVGTILSADIQKYITEVSVATSANNINTIVKRDGSGNFAGEVITGSTVKATTKLDFPGGISALIYNSSPWIDLPLTVKSAIGVGASTGGTNGKPLLAYAFQDQDWFTDALAGDVCFLSLNGKRILFGNTNMNHSVSLSNDKLTVKNLLINGIDTTGTATKTDATGDTLALRDSTGGSSFSTVKTNKIESLLPTLNIASDSTTSTLNIANANAIQTVNIGTGGMATKTVQIGSTGTTINLLGDETNIKDKMVVLNSGGLANSGGMSGIYFQEAGDTSAGYIRINNDRNKVQLKPFTMINPIELDQSLLKTDSPTFVTVNANLSGTATTCTTIPTLSGDVTSMNNVVTVNSVKSFAPSTTHVTGVSTLVQRDTNGDFSARNITAMSFLGNATSATSFTGSLNGDVSGSQSTTKVDKVTGTGATPPSVTSDQIITSVGLTTAATSLNNPNAIVRRDTNGDFSARNITATTFVGSIETAINFTGSLIGDVTGNQTTTKVVRVTGTTGPTNGVQVSSDRIITSVQSTEGATDSNLTSRIVKRDTIGDFSARNITANRFVGTADSVNGRVIAAPLIHSVFSITTGNADLIGGNYEYIIDTLTSNSIFYITISTMCDIYLPFLIGGTSYPNFPIGRHIKIIGGGGGNYRLRVLNGGIIQTGITSNTTPFTFSGYNMVEVFLIEIINNGTGQFATVKWAVK